MAWMSLGILRTRPKFQLYGGNLCLDFTNTLDERGSEKTKELLPSYSDLLAWSLQVGIVNRRLADKLLRLSNDSPGQATTALRSAVQLREALYSIFSAIAERRVVPGNALAILNAAAQRAGAHAQVVHSHPRFVWDWVSPETSLDSLLWPIAGAATALLTSEDLGLVRVCAAETCAWLFLDKTKNHRRRWCDMRTCGNRDKARRYYQRRRA